MRVLANQKIKSFLYKIVVSILLFLILLFSILHFHPNHEISYIVIACLMMTVSILLSFYQYFRDQHRIIEDAVWQVTDYIAGNQEARIECNEEGELYQLLHEVNTLVSILNARAENEKKSKEFLKTTISDISHQLKTPLAALNIYNGILQEEEIDPATIKEFTNLSEQELDRIDTLVQNLLKITKLDAGTILMEKNVENVSELMECVKKHFAYRVKSEEKSIEFIGNDDLTLLCDHDWIIEAIDNIVKNAIDHTKQGDTIKIEWKKFASVVQIVIKDNGSGIHTEDLPFIFRRFYRSRFSKDTTGIGLGLPLAKAVIEAHNGTIEVDSDLSVGTTFTINFLVAREG